LRLKRQFAAVKLQPQFIWIVPNLTICAGSWGTRLVLFHMDEEKKAPWAKAESLYNPATRFPDGISNDLDHLPGVGPKLRRCEDVISSLGPSQTKRKKLVLADLIAIHQEEV